jgi:alpha-galactosidase
VPAARIQAEAHLCTAAYLRPHQEDFERLHKFLVETDGLSEVSDDMRKLVEEEWPELVHKLPPRVPQSG